MSTVATAPVFGAPRAARRPAARRTAPAVRLTRRGRVVATVFFLGLLLAAFTVLGGHSAATDTAGAPVPTRSVQVHEGDTLWSIASQVAEPGEVRAMIHRIEELNALPGPALREGQELAVPVQ